MDSILLQLFLKLGEGDHFMKKMTFVKNTEYTGWQNNAVNNVVTMTVINNTSYILCTALVPTVTAALQGPSSVAF